MSTSYHLTDFRVHSPIFREIPALGVTIARFVFGYAILEHNQVNEALSVRPRDAVVSHLIVDRADFGIHQQYLLGLI